MDGVEIITASSVHLMGDIVEMQQRHKVGDISLQPRLYCIALLATSPICDKI